MHLICESIVDGVGPSEKVVRVKTSDGYEEVVVYAGSISGRALDVGPAIRRDGNKFLVELPRESASGRWRFWVPDSAVAAS